METSADDSENRAKQHIERGEFRPAYELLRSRTDLGPRATFYLAVCSSRLQPERRQDAIDLFDLAEKLGFTDSELYQKRAQLLSELGRTDRALKDAITVLRNDPRPQAIELALSLICPAEGSGARQPIGGVAGNTAILLSAVWSHVKALRAQHDFMNRKILMVDKGDFRAFVYEGDLSATSMPQRKTVPEAPLAPRQFVNRWNKSQDLLMLLVAWYLAEGMPPAFLDIGSNVGADAIRIAKLSRVFNQRFPITSFEPGVMAALVPHNLRLNKVAGLVAFEERCVSDNDLPTVLFGEIGASVNNRIVNRKTNTEGFSKIVEAVTVAQHLSALRFKDRHPILKIDTQGAEWMVWNGMKPEIGKRCFSMVMELTPWALAPSVPPKQFLGEVLEHFLVFDLGHGRRRVNPVSGDNLEQFLTTVWREAPYWTDLLCISRQLSSADRLIARINTGYAEEAPAQSPLVVRESAGRELGAPP
jgi:FkbM family methyltransferase